jgi:thymidine kinase
MAEGSAEAWVGPMFSGKSTSLIARATRFADVGYNTCYITHTNDERLTESGDGTVTTHNSGFVKLSKKIKSFKVSSLNEINLENFDVIAVDEFQFFKNTVDPIRNLIINLNKRVLIGSLDLDYLLRPFGEINQLFGFCDDNIHRMPAICVKCHPNETKDAWYTLKLTTDTSQIDPGGSDKYIPVCMKCYKKYNIHK